MYGIHIPYCCTFIIIIIIIIVHKRMARPSCCSHDMQLLQREVLLLSARPVLTHVVKSILISQLVIQCRLYMLLIADALTGSISLLYLNTAFLSHPYADAVEEKTRPKPTNVHYQQQFQDADY